MGVRQAPPSPQPGNSKQGNAEADRAISAQSGRIDNTLTSLDVWRFLFHTIDFCRTHKVMDTAPFTLENTQDAPAVFHAPSCSPCRFAYADPPYYGLAVKFYGHLHPDAAEYDKLETHAALIERLNAEYDGWAMSLHERSLRDILPLCPPDARVMAWVKGFASFKPGIKQAQFAWEPIIVRGGRPFTENHCVRDWIQESMTLKRGFRGAKPERVIRWLLDVLNAQRQDIIDDIFPGSGGVSVAIEKWRTEGALFCPANV